MEAETAEEAQALLASGQGHHAELGERVDVELESMLDGAGATAAPLSNGHAVFCSLRPSSLTISSRMRNFCTLPVTVMGNASTNLM